ncbi:MAG: response regulator [Candidatus Nitronauta litoralis]|uniref:histidine kinase n=1 Tax=Candidatus Nitronauta litoralis TaxID=2705533 RepID=A0A7T0BXB2_9BACT|nr:MAG: response regulator [Candidatus Nitronauta litoralis]
MPHRDEMKFEDRLNIIRGVPFLRHLSEEQISEFADEGNYLSFDKGQIVFNDGDHGDSMFIILSGCIEIFKQNKHIAMRGAGDYFGEMAMIEMKPRSASAKALGDSFLIEIGKHAFDKFLGSNPDIIREFLLTISHRCRVDLDIIDSGFLELCKNEERYRTIVETISDIVLQIDPDGLIDFANSSVSFLGYTPQELKGQPLQSIISEKGDSLMEDLLTKRVGPRATSDVEVMFKVKEDCPIYEFMQEVSFLVDAHGLWDVRNDLVIKKGYNKNFLGTLCIARDHTQRKKSEEEAKKRQEELENLVKERTQILELAKKEAEQANFAKSDFLSKVSHELRTPLNAIIGFSHLLQMSEGEHLDPEKIEFVNHINDAGNHLLNLIKEILDLSRIETDKVELEIENVDMVALVEEQAVLVLPQAQKEGITINCQTPSKKQIFAKGDLVKIKQVVLNLLTNGIKYNRPNGNVEITVEEKEPSSVLLRVNDTGKGIKKEDRWKVFEPFQRLDWEHTDVEGTGIGLTICQRLVHLMKGQIGFESVLDQGTCFFVELPRGNFEPESQFTLKGESPKKPGAKKLKDFKILYIEDETINVELVRGILGKFDNIRLFTAKDASTGIEMTEALNPDLILLDIHLPGTDGYDVLKILKEKPLTKHTPVIAVTAQAMKGDREKGLKEGFDKYLTKPLEINQFIDTIFSYQK